MSSDSGSGAAPGRTRASDAEREEYAKRVRDAMAEGRLRVDEGDERLAGVYAVTYRDELPPLVADLPRDDTHDDPRRDPRRRGHHGERRPQGGAGEWGAWHPYRRRGRGVGLVALLVLIAAVTLAITTSHGLWLLFPLAFFLLVGRGCARWAYRRRWE